MQDGLVLENRRENAESGISKGRLIHVVINLMFVTSSRRSQADWVALQRKRDQGFFVEPSDKYLGKKV